jgi:hypothetical protein
MNKKLYNMVVFKNVLFVMLITIITALLIFIWPHDFSDFDALNRNLDGSVRQVF